MESVDPSVFVLISILIHFITMAIQIQLTDVVERDWKKKSLKLIQILSQR